jgi:uncharacterized membrane protein YbhN (UPF0104 family)
MLAFLCLRFLGVEASNLIDVLTIQLTLIFLIYFAPTPGGSGLAEGLSCSLMAGIVSSGFAPYYNLLWRTSTLYLPAIIGLLFLLGTMTYDARKVFPRAPRSGPRKNR